MGGTVSRTTSLVLGLLGLLAEEGAQVGGAPPASTQLAGLLHGVSPHLRGGGEEAGGESMEELLPLLPHPLHAAQQETNGQAGHVLQSRRSRTAQELLSPETCWPRSGLPRYEVYKFTRLQVNTI